MIARRTGKVGLDPEGRIAFRVADAADLPYDDDSFDLVAQLNMPPFFAEIARVLRPGGHVVVAASWGAGDPVLHAASRCSSGLSPSAGSSPSTAGSAGPGTYWVGRASRSRPV